MDHNTIITVIQQKQYTPNGTYFSSWACSFSSGSIFSRTTENFTLATTQAANGAAATLARLAI